MSYPGPADLLEFAIVGLVVVLQHIPLSVTSVSFTSVIVPPLVIVILV